MTLSTLLAGAFGAGIAAGLILLGVGVRGRFSTGEARWRKWLRQRQHGSPRWPAASIISGLVVGWFTGWVVGGLLTALAMWSLPRVLGGDKEHDRRVARIEAVAAWAEMLRDTLAAAAGLEQAITATVDTAPEAIRDDIRELSVRLERGDRLPVALRELADDLADPTADLVLSALVLASQHQARQLTELLGELATEAREQVSMRLRVEAGRARTRTSVRVIVGTTLAFAAGLVVLNRGYLAPYDGVAGQLMLLMVGGLFGLAFWWLGRITRASEPERFLTHLTASAHDRREVPA
ncbi:Flp pilus assembly protein TadB [Saccharopolyspora lacisalsi]|uniref:Flp pilus assembly protein TadB n=1 Tax=Halosaccharopolyspora lacisalsi TaxID=1000566 RepID=A0A839DQL8_9PSEU|nr:type II secretion system F family protein [Halosaccharopolyspora lacisalsi]MBA8823804.1 Flp pilus assembly protein TadB [Halosaccharopolyspora lacisalsi]